MREEERCYVINDNKHTCDGGDDVDDDQDHYQLMEYDPLMQ
jgi:hypothetical protein